MGVSQMKKRTFIKCLSYLDAFSSYGVATWLLDSAFDKTAH